MSRKSKKRDSGTSAFLWILWNFWEHLFHRKPLTDYFYYPKTSECWVKENPDRKKNVKIHKANQLFSRKFYEMFQKSFFTEYARTTAS